MKKSQFLTEWSNKADRIHVNGFLIHAKLNQTETIKS